MKHYMLRFIYILAVFILFLSFMQQAITIAYFDELKSRLSTTESIDLFIRQNIGLTDSHFQRIIPLSKEWDILLLNLTIQNHGEILDNVFISTSINGIISESLFETYDRTQPMKRLAYQFEQRQSLVSPLNYSFEEIQTVNLSISLEPQISSRRHLLNFSILAAVIHCIEFDTFENSLHVQHFPIIYTFFVRTANTPFISSNILISFLIPIEIPPNREFVAMIKLKMSGAKFEVISLNNDKNYIFNETEGEIRTVVKHNMIRNKIWNLKISINPSFVSNEDYKLILISSEIHGVFQDATSTRRSELQDRPIPISIMLPILVIFLFCVPYYYVFKEETEKKVQKVIDGNSRELEKG
ncbi:MAG: hypothetical protein ACXABI_09270 [Candidatus Hodarchaeales archaeon]|jgi:hypothetical protein